MTSKEYAKSLRLVADFYDKQEEDFPNPGDTITNSLYWNGEGKEKVRKISKALGKCKKRFASDVFYLEKLFGNITLSFYFNRNDVCTRKVVGIRIVPAQPAREAQPERTEDEYEWVCGTMLGEDIEDDTKDKLDIF